MLKLITQLKLSTKIVLLSTLVTTIVAVIIGTTVYSRSSEVIRRQARDNISGIIQQSALFLDEKWKSMFVQVHFLQTTESFRDAIIELNDEQQADYAMINEAVKAMLVQISSRDDFIETMCVYTPKVHFDDKYIQKNVLTPEDETYLYEYYYNKVKESGIVYWGNNDEDPIARHTLTAVAFRVSLGIEFYTANRSNILVIYLDGDELTTHLNEISKESGGDIYLMNEVNEIIYSSNGSDHNDLADQYIQETVASSDLISFQSNKGSEKLIINVAKIKINDWKLVSVQKESILLSALNDIQTFVLFVTVFIIGIAVFLSIQISRSITEPARVLKKLMKEAPDKQFSLRYEGEYHDEIDDIGRGFNQMSEKILSLIEDLRVEEQMKSFERTEKIRAEIRALQEQINPHFLYNALDSIYWKATIQGNEEIGDIAIALSNVFRIGLNKGKDLITVNKEFEHVRNYLMIQKKVYTDRFDYTVRMEPAIANNKIIKILLQPLVENSILHGFHDMDGMGVIEVKGMLKEDKIVLQVCDNGCGFELNPNIVSLKKSSTGYALGNIIQRLKLYYGDHYKIQVDSESYVKTTVTITVPREYESSEEETSDV